MDTKLYRLNVQVTLAPLIYNGPPDVVVKFGNQILFNGSLDQPQIFSVDSLLPTGQENLSIEFLNKTSSDTNIRTGQDKAVLIKQISFNGITSPKFIWAGNYYPTYPTHMDPGLPVLSNIDYLGWNGVWKLDFNIPIFTWIHGIEQMGWIFK